jgi:hypothetical protein
MLRDWPGGHHLWCVLKRTGARDRELFVLRSPARPNTNVVPRALQHYLGHKNIQHTVRYTVLAPDRFKDF